MGILTESTNDIYFCVHSHVNEWRDQPHPTKQIHAQPICCNFCTVRRNHIILFHFTIAFLSSSPYLLMWWIVRNVSGFHQFRFHLSSVQSLLFWSFNILGMSSPCRHCLFFVKYFSIKFYCQTKVLFSTIIKSRRISAACCLERNYQMCLFIMTLFKLIALISFPRFLSAFSVCLSVQLKLFTTAFHNADDPYCSPFSIVFFLFNAVNVAFYRRFCTSLLIRHRNW